MDVTYTYDSDNLRTSKTVDGITELYTYDEQANLALVFDTDGNLVSRYLYGMGMDSILAEENADGMVWALTDHQGSVTQVVSQYGDVVEEREFSAFGVGEFVSFRFGYTGREFDAEAGLYYYRNRYYDQQVGKFISSDPIAFEGGDRNLFRYVGNDAVNKIDADGLRGVAIPRPAPRISPVRPSLRNPNRSGSPSSNPFPPSRLPNPFQASPNEGYLDSDGRFVFPKYVPPSPTQLELILPFPKPKPTDINLFLNAEDTNLPTKAPETLPVFTDKEKIKQGSVFIPKPRSGQPGKSRRVKPPNPNQCPVKEDCPTPLPVFYEDASLFEHYTLVVTAIRRDKQPTVLTRADSVLKGMNRVFTNDYYRGRYGPATNYSRTGRPAEWDEYPYASTLEGGFGATVGAVDKNENRRAGEQLTAFFRMIPLGCQFEVRI